VHRAFGWTSQTHNNKTPGQRATRIAQFIALRFAHAAGWSLTANVTLIPEEFTQAV